MSITQKFELSEQLNTVSFKKVLIWKLLITLNEQILSVFSFRPPNYTVVNINELKTEKTLLNNELTLGAHVLQELYEVSWAASNQSNAYYRRDEKLDLRYSTLNPISQHNFPSLLSSILVLNKDICYNFSVSLKGLVVEWVR